MWRILHFCQHCVSAHQAPQIINHLLFFFCIFCSYLFSLVGMLRVLEQGFLGGNGTLLNIIFQVTPCVLFTLSFWKQKMYGTCLFFELFSRKTMKWLFDFRVQGWILLLVKGLPFAGFRGLEVCLPGGKACGAFIAKTKQNKTTKKPKNKNTSARRKTQNTLQIIFQVSEA